MSSATVEDFLSMFPPMPEGESANDEDKINELEHDKGA